jgi:hypothetical protein
MQGAPCTITRKTLERSARECQPSSPIVNLPANMYSDLQPNSAAKTSSVLFWMGLALISVFSTAVLAGLFPLGLLLPAWQVRVGNLILSNAHFAGIGAILIFLAQQLNSDSFELERWVRRLQVLAIPAAIGFFLLVPLQTYNGYKLLRIASGEERQAIGQLQKTLGAIQSAQNEAALRAAISQIPGAPPNLGNIAIPLPEAKKGISERLIAQINKLDNQFDELNASRWQDTLLGWARNSLIALCYGAGFAEIANFPKSKNSLLFSILKSLPWIRQKRAPFNP